MTPLIGDLGTAELLIIVVIAVMVLLGLLVAVLLTMSASRGLRRGTQGAAPPVSDEDR